MPPSRRGRPTAAPWGRPLLRGGGPITAGATTCVAVVQAYIARVRAYNGVASALVTADGAPVAPASGTVRAGKALRFPTETVKASTVLPKLDQYTGPPLEYGRM